MIIKKRVYLLSFGFFFILINLFVSMTLEILGTARTLMIDNVLKQRIGIESADLPDTSTFANGLDAIEEGGEGLMQENDEEEP